ncbi:glycosyltransferase family 9 protein [Microbacterium sp. 8M]|uniref:glycosyltransferase family 9 protein n=1 Tax=Microbacterium sp. 8M TaxID=2653153 RepID=UPI00135C69AC|nr:glycosyltransferase family 9 protein [Microbacterium sp. 8M]
MRRFDRPEDRPVLLALRALKLGDLLVAVPALHGLRRAFGGHELVLAVSGWLEQIVELVDGIDALLPTPGLDEPLPVPPGAVDVAANLHGNGPESRALIDALRPRRRIAHRSPGNPDGPEWVDGMHERVRWARLVTAHGAPADPDDVRIRVPSREPHVEGAAVVHVGAFYGARQWPVERFAAVARALRGDGARVVVTGGASDRARAEALAERAGIPGADVRAGRSDLADLAALIAHAGVVVSADTGAAHLASAYGTPSVVIFGPAPASEWGPPPGPHLVLTDEARRRGDVFADDPDPALLAITSEDVIRAARAVQR